MELPATVRVKLSSEEAGYLSFTPVVIRQMPLGELLELILAATGKDPERVDAVLQRGTLLSGASRLRWEGLRLASEELRAALAGFPESDPGRRFEPRRCVAVVLKAADGEVEIARAAGAARRLLQRGSFWDALMELATRQPLRYVTYCYRRRADCYAAEVPPAAALELKTRAARLRYSSLAKQVRQAHLESVEFYVARK